MQRGLSNLFKFIGDLAARQLQREKYNLIPTGCESSIFMHRTNGGKMHVYKISKTVVPNER